ncbi:hypothetical protein EJ08DRAFT_303878 [Tothia fuscella]|uniref:Uncharacterized protein n=1 Tax=Tothia fuscella TaxID=1048955 RepID=A0A9P4TWF9_9PEZI|nr:hypothetical protein EJ08DRAFT_303878 [Tothia fuscella]
MVMLSSLMVLLRKVAILCVLHHLNLTITILHFRKLYSHLSIASLRFSPSARLSICPWCIVVLWCGFCDKTCGWSASPFYLAHRR